MHQEQTRKEWVLSIATIVMIAADLMRFVLSSQIP
jgi:hypothetical protein